MFGQLCNPLEKNQFVVIHQLKIGIKIFSNITDGNMKNLL